MSGRHAAWNICEDLISQFQAVHQLRCQELPPGQAYQVDLPQKCGVVSQDRCYSMEIRLFPDKRVTLTALASFKKALNINCNWYMVEKWCFAFKFHVTVICWPTAKVIRVTVVQRRLWRVPLQQKLHQRGVCKRLKLWLYILLTGAVCHIQARNS